jgi:hypothetical protein
MSDEEFFGRAAAEYEQGKIDSNLMAKAKVLAEGQDNQAQYKYITLRIEQMKKQKSQNVKTAAMEAGIIIAPAVGSYLLWLLKGVIVFVVIAFGIVAVANL